MIIFFRIDVFKFSLNGIPLIFGLFKHYLTFFLVNMDSKWLNKLYGVKYWEVSPFWWVSKSDLIVLKEPRYG